MKQQRKHAEISALTYNKNVGRCLEIHKERAEELFECLAHNTDKVDRRFFGYYYNQRAHLLQQFI